MVEKPGKSEATSEVNFAQGSIGMEELDLTAEVDHSNQEEDYDQMNEMEDETSSSSESLPMETMNESHSSQDTIPIDDENQMEMPSSPQVDQEMSEPTSLNQNGGIWWSSYKCPKCFKSFTCNNQRNKHVSVCPYFDTDAGSEENSIDREADGGSPIAEVDHFNHELDDEQLDNMEKQACCISESFSMETMNHQKAGNEPSANSIVSLNSSSSNFDMESRDFPSGTSSTDSENSVDIQDLDQVFNDIPTETPTVPQEGQVNNSDKLESRAPRKSLRSLFKCSKCRKTFTSNERRNLHLNECQRYENDSVSDDDSNDGVDNFEQDLRMDTNTGQNIIIVAQHVEQDDSNRESSALIYSGNHDNYDDSLDGMPDLTIEGDVGVCEERLLQLESARNKNVISQPVAEESGETVSAANISQAPTNVTANQSDNISSNEPQPSNSNSKSIPTSRLVGLVSESQEHPSKKYKCNFPGCNKQYHHRQSLHEHKKIHTGAVRKKHQCNYKGCSSKFFRKFYLVQHYRKHTGEKPYICTVCQRAFSRSSILVKHKNAKHGSRPLGT